MMYTSIALRRGSMGVGSLCLRRLASVALRTPGPTKCWDPTQRVLSSSTTPKGCAAACWEPLWENQPRPASCYALLLLVSGVRRRNRGEVKRMRHAWACGSLAPTAARPQEVVCGRGQSVLASPLHGSRPPVLWRRVPCLCVIA